jgi:hypothetical protein
MNQQTTPEVSEVYFAQLIPGSFKAGIGRQIVPHAVSHEDWKASGAVVRDEPYDVHAISIANRGEGKSDIWSIVVKDEQGEDSREVFEVEQLPWNSADREHPQARYEGLAATIEQQLGRTGLTILIS